VSEPNRGGRVLVHTWQVWVVVFREGEPPGIFAMVFDDESDANNYAEWAREHATEVDVQRRSIYVGRYADELNYDELGDAQPDSSQAKDSPKEADKRNLTPGKRYSVMFSGANLGGGLEAQFERYSEDADATEWSNGVAIGPLDGDWRAEELREG
jgi:hypothetical protein